MFFDLPNFPMKREKSWLLNYINACGILLNKNEHFRFELEHKFQQYRNDFPSISMACEIFNTSSKINICDYYKDILQWTRKPMPKISTEKHFFKFMKENYLINGIAIFQRQKRKFYLFCFSFSYLFFI